MRLGRLDRLGRSPVRERRRLGGAPAGDTEAPTKPGLMSASAITETSLTLTWGASTDNTEVINYRVEQAVGAGAFAWLATVAAPTVTLDVTGLTASTAYRFRVLAEDAAGNQSAWEPDADGLDVTTAAAFSFAAPAFSTASADQVAIYAMAEDGAGGFFVGGRFDEVTDSSGTHSRLNVCHLDADGQVTSWNPGSDLTVWDIALWGSDHVVVGKSYSSTLTNNTLGGFDCRGFGVVDRSTGVAVSWDPGVMFTIRNLAISGGNLFQSSSGFSSTAIDIWKWDLTAMTGAIFYDDSGIWGFNQTQDMYCDDSRNQLVWGGGDYAVLLADMTTGIKTTLFSTPSRDVQCIRQDTATNSLWVAWVGGDTTYGKGISVCDRDTGVDTGWRQDVGVASTSSGNCDALVVSGDVVLGGFDYRGVRAYDKTTGVTSQVFAFTGAAGGEYSRGNNWRAPATGKWILFGGDGTRPFTDISPGKESGSRGMFVISYT